MPSHDVSAGQLRATQTNPDRDPMDFYPTPVGFTRALLDRVPLKGRVWEPAAGDGAIVAVLKEYGYRVCGTDITHTPSEDFLTSNRRAKSIVTNPPYRLCTEFIRHGLAQTDGILCLLLASFHMSGKNRAAEFFFPVPPSDLIYVLDKMAVLGKTSVFNHVWFVWDKDYHGPTRFHWALVPKGERGEAYG